MDLLLISPPVANFGQATSGLSVLTAYLRASGWDAHQWDMAIDAFHHFHSPEYLRGRAEIVLRESTDETLRDTSVRVVDDIDSAKDALRTPGVAQDHDRMRWAFETINNAGIVITAASRGRYEHDFRHFGVNSAFRSFGNLEDALSDPAQNPYLEYTEQFVLPRLRRSKPRAVGISLTYFSQVMPGFTLARKIAEHLPDTPIVVGGAYLTAVEHDVGRIPSSLLPADAIILHDGEEALASWLEAVLGGKGSVQAIHNCYLPADTFARASASAQSFTHTDLDRVPTPMWTADGLHLDRYLVPKYPIPLPLARGCYWGRCAYCNISCQTAATYRTRSVDQAIEDMRVAMRETGSNWFDLPVDSYRPRDLHALATAIIESGLDVEWGAEVLLDPGFRDDVISDLARSGCRTLRFGLESASIDTLVAMNKPTRPDKARRILKACKKNGIQTAVMLIAGFPSENQSELNLTFDYLRDNREFIDFLTIHQYSLVPASPMANDPARFGLFLLEPEAVLWTSIPFVNTNPVGMKNEDLPRVIASMKSGLSEYYTDLGELWTVAIGGWMTFPACCGVRNGLVHPISGG
ncbi:MAG: hypothetical protein DRP71_08430 [Verrucomicrobia bacterium]|nr:MAG: hypothetical protein DRP71_08430 [Verrucomicrobiota bacterium]